ncbi:MULTISPECIES: stage III sporulation protein AA [Bacillaceae]|uniref:Stage III sporulation protein AA n=2 Tax=Bacteria TaxID=2 RepID=A0AA46P7U0_CYTFI|nr:MULTISPECIES: stage III sporulation protein AA [Bacillaceae]KML46045.1 stage III sporulation protein AA [Cytobacillus firmus]MBG9444898.1 stage III sporulation protein AA [Cytobacillus firmus]MBY6051259.1 stage III sporulation protein AA [Cytobacillus firmus]MCC3647721.1 stage III sporulation protein AA [Cytobacillus oceanisediminis]MCS0654182.1 stage III sporulation protein AA [Cytobacillus firmus]
METIIAFLPKKIAEQLQRIPPKILKDLEEIRVRISRPIELTARGVPHFLPYIIDSEDAVHLLNKISHFSIYTLEEELKRGYITIEGGHRVGLAGKVILEQGKVKAIRDISSFNIRIAREKVGIAQTLIPRIYRDGWLHTMIIGPPQTGKTTLLRDIARIISSGDQGSGLPASKVGIVDERSEIAGCVNGIPQMTFGNRIDVLDACPKAEGMMMMIRSMSPEVLVVDEIGRHEDAEAIMEAVNAGIKLIMTTHGNSLEEIKRRPTLQAILEMGVFQRFIELSRKDGPGSIDCIRNTDGARYQHQAGVM